MDLTRYNDLLRKLMQGDSSVLPELSQLQPKVLAWKQEQRKKAPQPKVEAEPKAEAESNQVIEKYKKKHKKAKEEE